jgi:sorbitol-specific phosphotransferase system component IIBC
LISDLTMKTKKQNGTAKANGFVVEDIKVENIKVENIKVEDVKVNTVKGNAVEQEPGAVATKKNNRKKKSKGFSQATKPKIQTEEPVSSALSKSKRRKER